MRLFLVCAALISWAGIARSQSSPLTCATGAVNPAVRAEGISETLGDILLTCSGGSAGTTMTLNLVVFLNVSVTNRLSGTNSFQKKAGTNDSGIRIAAVYTGFPAGARIFVPDVVAGSDALQPTAAGDLGGSPSGGAYAPGSGALLLSRVSGTDTSGAGGLPVYVPRPTG